MNYIWLIMLFCANQVVTYAKLRKMLHFLISSERCIGVQTANTWPVREFGLAYVDLDAHVQF